MGTVGERIQWILANRQISQRELARRCGLPLAHIGVIINRTRKNPASSIESDTLTAIARGAGVSLHWLATGEGSPERTGGEPRARGVLGELPGWYEAEALVRPMFRDTPEWVFECARNLASPHRPTTAGTELVLQAVLLCRSFQPPGAAANEASVGDDAESAEDDDGARTACGARRR